MNKSLFSIFAGSAAALAAASLASAQVGGAGASAGGRPAQEPAAAATRNASQRTLADVLMRMSRDTGLTVVADSTVAGQMVTPPAEATTPQNLEAQVAALVRTLPSGATWARLHLPTPAPGARAYTGDAVADYALAQAKLFGRVGDAPAGQVEVLGRTLAADAAAPVLTALDLKPVILVSNPSARAAASAAATAPPGTTATWTQMNDQQKQQFAQQEAQRIMNMDPAARQQVFQQQAAVMRAMMQNMTPDQRRQMFQGMGGWGGGRDGRRGGGRGPGGQ